MCILILGRVSMEHSDYICVVPEHNKFSQEVSAEILPISHKCSINYCYDRHQEVHESYRSDI